MNNVHTIGIEVILAPVNLALKTFISDFATPPKTSWPEYQRTKVPTAGSGGIAVGLEANVDWLMNGQPADCGPRPAAESFGHRRLCGGSLE